MTFDILRNEDGQGLTEYALIIALVAIVAVAALTLLGGQIQTIFGDINSDLGGGAQPFRSGSGLTAVIDFMPTQLLDVTVLEVQHDNWLRTA